MSPIPNKGFFDPPIAEDKMDSTKHNEQRAANYKAVDKEQRDVEAKREAKQKEEQEFRELEVKERDIAFLESNLKTATQPDTREMILDRIRKMREEKPPEIVYPPLTPEQQAQLEREQQAGREAVARAEAREAELRELRAKVEAEDRKRLGTMEPVYRHNHGQDVQAPAIGATLGKKHDDRKRT